jgi:methionyl-tRNA formyltransferase
MTLRLAFMGTPDFAVPVLQALLTAGHVVVAVYTQPPRPAGRGHRAQPSPVPRAADAAGAAPIPRAILADDRETGVTIMQMDEGLDTGPILLAESVAIGPEATAATLHFQLATLGARLIVRALAGRADGTLAARPQPAAGVTYAKKLARDEGRIDWSRPAIELERAVRALNPVPGVWFEHGAERIKVLAATMAESGATAPPGTVLDAGLTVACGSGALRLIRLRRAGRAAVDAEAFLRGYALPPGTRL